MNQGPRPMGESVRLDRGATRRPPATLLAGSVCWRTVFILLLPALSQPLWGQDEAVAPAESSCLKCHGEEDLWEGDRRKFFVNEHHLEDDVHWKKGLHCHDCHGGDPESTNFRQAHSPDAGYRAIMSPRDVPRFCGHCHSDVEYMKRFNPTPKTNQLADYLTSGHGRRLAESSEGVPGGPETATCITCHGRHGMRAVTDPQSPVFPTRLAQTCATCHSDATKMAGIQFHGKPLGHDQFDQWKTSVHATALLNKGDLSSATCNDCHGNHGALSPEPAAVSQICASCHVRIGELFAQTRMKHQFEKAQLPGCAACHGKHAIHQPTDEMLGMEHGAVCAKCHAQGQHGATLAGAEEALTLRSGLDELKHLIASAEVKLDQAERLGMEVRKPRFRLREARQALVNSRALIHSFAPEPMKSTLDAGLKVGQEVSQAAESALEQHRFRRIWLGLSLIPILIAVGLLLRFIRSVPLPE